MKVELIDIKDIHPYEKNPRRNKKAIEYVANSLKEYGFKQPLVVDKEHKIIVGHTRYQAARQLKLSQVPVIVAEDLTDEQVRAYRIADNKTHEYSLWDDTLLSEEIEALLVNHDLGEVAELTAFTERELDKLLYGKNYLTSLEEAAKNNNPNPKTERIALIIAKHGYINRGVGTFVNGWIELGLRHNLQVDVISTTDDVRNTQFERYEAVSPWLFRDDSTNIDDHIAMKEPAFRLEDAAILRNSIFDAMKTKQYTAFIANTPDALLAVASLGLHEYTPRVFYCSHDPADLQPGKTFNSDLTYALLRQTGIKVITQSSWMKSEIERLAGLPSHQVLIQMPPLGQPELLDFSQPEQERKGILFIGPYEDRKNPEEFIRVCKETGLPALLITPSQKSADKFKQRFLEEGIKHEIHVSLSGKSKVDAIKSAALAIIPSKRETFCYTAIEAATACPTLIPLEAEWSQVHKDWCHIVPASRLADEARRLYGTSITEEQKAALLLFQETSDQQGLDLLKIADIKIKEAKNALTKRLDQVGTISHAEFILSRPKPYIDEMYYTLKIMDNSDYTITHDFNTTYIKYNKYIPDALTQAEDEEHILQRLGIEVNAAD